MKTIALKHPIPYGEKALEELTLRKPMAGDLRGVKLRGIHDMDVDTVLTVTTKITTTPVTIGQLAALDPADLLALTEAVSDFFAG